MTDVRGPKPVGGARFEDAIHLAEKWHWFGHVLQGPIGVDGVEAGVGEGQVDAVVDMGLVEVGVVLDDRIGIGTDQPLDPAPQPPFGGSGVGPAPTFRTTALGASIPLRNQS